MASEGSKDLPIRPSAEQSLPAYIVERNDLFQKLWEQHLEDVKNCPHPEITVKVDIGNGNPSAVTAKAWETTPAQLLKDVPKEFSANVVVAKVDGELYDLSRPLERASTVSFLPFDDEEARMVFFHSSAHAMGEACECFFNEGCKLSHGPPTPQGFFYDMAIQGE